MHSGTPLNCPKKPGEPGGEKLTEAERDQVLQLASNCWDRDWFPNSEDQQLLFDWIDRRVAGALAACALEVRREALKEAADTINAMPVRVTEYSAPYTAVVDHAVKCRDAILATLERAAKGKA